MPVETGQHTGTGNTEGSSRSYTFSTPLKLVATMDTRCLRSWALQVHDSLKTQGCKPSRAPCLAHGPVYISRGSGGGAWCWLWVRAAGMGRNLLSLEEQRFLVQAIPVQGHVLLPAGQRACSPSHAPFERSRCRMPRTIWHAPASLLVRMEAAACVQTGGQHRLTIG